MPSWVWVLVGGIALALVLRRFVGRPDPANIWRQLAEGLGLRYEQGGATGPSVRGRYGDVEVRVTGERDPATLPGAPISAILQAEISLPGTIGIWGAASQRMGGGEDPWSKPGRDAIALVRQHNSKSVVDALRRSDVHRQVTAFLSRHERARIADDWVTLVVPGPLRDAKRLHLLLDEVAAMARAFTEASAKDGARAPMDDPYKDMPDEERGSVGQPSIEEGTLAKDRAQPTNPYAPPALPGASSRPWSEPKPMVFPTVDPAMASRWKKRTAVAFLLGILPSGLGACLAMIAGIRTGHLLWGMQAIWWVLLGGALFGLGFLVFMSSYNCPKCGKFIRSPQSGRIVMDPEHCPHCHTRLRDPTPPGDAPPS